MPRATLTTSSRERPAPSQTPAIGRVQFDIRLRHRERRIRQVMRELRARRAGRQAQGVRSRVPDDPAG